MILASEQKKCYVYFKTMYIHGRHFIYSKCSTYNLKKYSFCIVHDPFFLLSLLICGCGRVWKIPILLTIDEYVIGSQKKFATIFGAIKFWIFLISLNSNIGLLYSSPNILIAIVFAVNHFASFLYWLLYSFFNSLLLSYRYYKYYN